MNAMAETMNTNSRRYTMGQTHQPYCFMPRGIIGSLLGLWTIGVLMWSPAAAQRLIDIQITGNRVDITQEAVFQVSLEKSGGPVWCGLRIDFGNGSRRDIRVGEKGEADLQLLVNYRYPNAGLYTVRLAGVGIIRGLKSASACEGAERVTQLRVTDLGLAAPDRQPTPEQGIAAALVSPSGLPSSAPSIPQPLPMLPAPMVQPAPGSPPSGTVAYSTAAGAYGASSDPPMSSRPVPPSVAYPGLPSVPASPTTSSGPGYPRVPSRQGSVPNVAGPIGSMTPGVAISSAPPIGDPPYLPAASPRSPSTAPDASGDRFVCGGWEVPRNLRTCPDGTAPIYIAPQVKPSRGSMTSGKQGAAASPDGASDHSADAARSNPGPTEDAGSGRYFCGSGQVSASVRTCQDGTLPRFFASRVQPNEQPSCAVHSVFGREWRLFIQGASYVTENTVDGTRTVHVNPGTGDLPLTLTIFPDGNYLWKAYGETIRGTWVLGRNDYPVLLKRGYNGKDWLATLHRCQLLLWDGNSLAGQFSGR